MHRPGGGGAPECPQHGAALFPLGLPIPYTQGSNGAVASVSSVLRSDATSPATKVDACLDAWLWRWESGPAQVTYWRGMKDVGMSDAFMQARLPVAAAAAAILARAIVGAASRSPMTYLLTAAASCARVVPRVVIIGRAVLCGSADYFDKGTRAYHAASILRLAPSCGLGRAQYQDLRGKRVCFLLVSLVGKSGLSTRILSKVRVLPNPHNPGRPRWVAARVRTATVPGSWVKCVCCPTHIT